MSTWEIVQFSKPKLKDPIFISGVKGIGDLGKTCSEYLIDILKCKKFMQFFSYNLPGLVNVDESNLVNLPAIELYYKKTRLGQDLIILVSDSQPSSEKATYELCDLIIKVLKENGTKYMVILGGVGVDFIEDDTKIYFSANSQEIYDKFCDLDGIDKEISGNVGPILGMSGILMGLGILRNLESICLLGETQLDGEKINLDAIESILNVLSELIGKELSIDKLRKLADNNELLLNAENILKQFEYVTLDDGRYIG